jgi:hypothetical protein
MKGHPITIGRSDLPTMAIDQCKTVIETICEDIKLQTGLGSKFKGYEINTVQKTEANQTVTYDEIVLEYY